MTNAVTKKVTAVALAASMSIGGAAVTTTATVVATTAAVSALSTSPAVAVTCKTEFVRMSASSAGGIAKFRKRRAERRAKAAWEDEVSRKFGSRYADFDDANGARVTFGVTQRGNTSATASGSIVICF